MQTSITVLLLIATICQIVVAQFNQCTGSDSCININECARFGPHFHEPAKWSDTIRNEFRSRVCEREKTSNGNIYKVCCQRSVTSNINRKRGLEVLDLERCGAYVEDRIAFGQDAELFQFPWMALLKPKVGSFLCGGTLINERYVLTAAHCIENNDIAIVRLGEFDLKNTIDCDGHGECADPPQDIPVERSILHESYSSRRKVNDIALLRLAQPAAYNYNVAPICLPVSSAMRTTLKTYFVAGWDATESATRSDRLRFTRLNLLSNNECQQQLDVLDRHIKLNDDQMCAIGSNLTDNCIGGLAGPLSTYSVSAHFVQYGIASLGLRTCGKQSAPVVYTKVENYIDWILGNLEE